MGTNSCDNSNMGSYISAISKTDSISGINESDFNSSFLGHFFKENLEKYANLENIIYYNLPFWWHLANNGTGRWIKEFPIKFKTEDYVSKYSLLFNLAIKMDSPFQFSLTDFACQKLKTIPNFIVVNYSKSSGLTLDCQKEDPGVMKFIINTSDDVLKKLGKILNQNELNYFQTHLFNEANGLSKNGKYIAGEKIQLIKKEIDAIQVETGWLQGLDQYFKLKGETEDKNNEMQIKLKKNLFIFLCLNKICFPEINSIVFAISKVFTQSDMTDVSFGGVISAFHGGEDENKYPFDLEREVFDDLWIKMNIKFREWAIWQWAEKQRKELLIHSTKSALAAIMSRNGSHNIGSHVISSVTQNFNELTDDKQLFSYIQQRMDFIAQITTEIPDWHFPFLFVQDMMRRFYMQRHLLNYICGAEGLSAFEYQGRNNNGHIPINDEIKNKVIIKIKKEGEDNFIISPEANNADASCNDLVQVAIPGGVVGQHAFFTILENILRNAAKHNWSGTKESEKPENLVLTISYEDHEENDFVLIKIWDNVSNVFKDTEIEASLENALKIHKSSSEKRDPPLHQIINEKLEKHFIDIQTGKLLNGNWGLAEMKICAAYLNKQDITKFSYNTGSILFDRQEKSGFISAIGQLDKDKNANPIYRLCYQIPIPKPKELLFYCNEDKIKQLNNKSINSGVYFSSDDKKGFDYEFIVFTDPNQIIKHYSDILEKEIFPFRLILLCNNDNQDSEEINNLLKFRRLVLINKSLNDYLSKYQLEEDGCWNKIKLNIYVEWIKEYYKKSIGDGKPLSMLVELQENGNNGGASIDGLLQFLKKLTINPYENDNIKVAEKILSKYEEGIETLPFVFRAKSNIHPQNNFLYNVNEKLEKDVSSICQYKENDLSGADIILKRHSVIITRDNNSLYQESLSGAQIYYNLFNPNLSKYFVNKFTLMLVENALLKIKIVDERFVKFFVKSGKDRSRFDHGGKISPVYSFKYGKNEKTIVSLKTKNIDPQKNDYYVDFDSPLDVDVLIIHQTILEGFLKTPKEMDEFVKKLKNNGVNVIITSGRGTPDKLPNNVNFLPFSNLESFLIKNYPEKFLLTQAIMNIKRKNEAINE